MLLTVPDARAQQHAGAESLAAVIELERAPGSQACPDKEAVFRSIRRLFPERPLRESGDAANSTVRAQVTIRPLTPGHEAVLTLLPPRHGKRVIREPDEDCRGLADALALAFMMLVAPSEPTTESEAPSAIAESSAAATSPATPPAPPQKPAEPQKSARAVEPLPASASAARSYRAGVGASLVGGLAVLSEPTWGGAGEVELFHRSGWGLSLQGLRLWAQPAEAEGGSVTLTLWGLLVAPCYRQRLTAAASLDACLRFGVGSQYAEIEGFVAPQSGNFPWQVLVPQISYRQGLLGLEHLLSAFVRLGLVGQLRPQSFSVRLADGSGDLVQIAGAPGLGVMAEIGVIFGTGLF